MSAAVVLAVLGGLVFIVLVELVAAVLPLLLVIALVPSDERRELAELLAAADSSRRLRLWPALRAAVSVRRRDRRRRSPGAPPRSPLYTGRR